MVTETESESRVEQITEGEFNRFLQEQRIEAISAVAIYRVEQRVSSWEKKRGGPILCPEAGEHRTIDMCKYAKSNGYNACIHGKAVIQLVKEDSLGNGIYDKLIPVVYVKIKKDKD